MFGIDFYPTQKETIAQMLNSVVIQGKTILEPSAGSGNIVDYCNEMLANEVLACEIDSNLRKILSCKCNIIENDFFELTPDKISHVDFIIMNPPFSAQEKHILHAWDIAPAGCQIISLCNSAMIENAYSKLRESIRDLIKKNGYSENFGECFNTSERKTDVSVSCIWLFKPGTGENEFEGYFDLNDSEQEEIDTSGIVRYDFVQDIVSRYVDAVSQFENVEAANKMINDTISGVVQGFNISFGAKVSGRDNEYQEISRDVFKKELQKAAWKQLFSFFKMGKYMTTGVMASINKFVEKQVHVPFTVKNIYLMIQMVAGTHSSRMNDVLVEAFEKICSFSYENCTAGEGWRTNTDFIINKKFILPRVTESNYGGGVGISYRSADALEDIIKALCFLTGKNYDNEISLSEWVRNKYHIKNIETGEFLSGYDNSFTTLNRACDRLASLNRNMVKYELKTIDNSWGTWIEWGFFRIKGFKKGTMHFEFKDEALWCKFNQKVIQIKGWSNMVTHSKKGRTRRK